MAKQKLQSPADTPKEQLEMVIKGLAEVKAAIPKMLTFPEHNNIVLTLTSDFDRMLNRLCHMTGTSLQGEAKTVQFPPITEFMGEKLHAVKPVEVEDIEPSEADRLIYLNKVDKLEAEFLSLSTDGILHSYTLPEDKLVIRGVAKRAGLESYADADINESFLNKIADALKQKEADKQKQLEIEAELQKQKESDKQKQEGGNKTEENNPPA